MNLKLKTAFERHADKMPRLRDQTDSMFNFEEWMAVMKSHKFVAFPLFFIQNFVRSKVLGKKFWERHRQNLKDTHKLANKVLTKVDKQKDRARVHAAKEKQLALVAKKRYWQKQEVRQ